MHSLLFLSIRELYIPYYGKILKEGLTMRTAKHRKESKFVKHLRKTYKNKIVALLMILISMLAVKYLNNCTALVITGVCIWPLIFGKKSYY